MAIDYKKRCADCVNLVEKNKVWCCAEMWDRPCEEVDDCPEDIDVEEIQEIENKTADFKVDHGAKAEDTEKKAKKPKTVKVSTQKQALFDLIWEGLSNYYGENAEIVIQNKQIAVKIDDKSIKIDLVEHRNKKK